MLRFSLYLLLWIPIVCSAQNFDKFNIRANINFIRPFESFEKTYLNADFKDYTYQKPTVLGNLSNTYSEEIALIYAGFSTKYQPEVVIRMNGYALGNSDFYRNFAIHSISLGLGFGVKLLEVNSLTLSANLTIFAGYSKLTSDSLQMVIGFPEDVNLRIDYSARKLTFLNPSVDIGGSLLYQVTDRIGVQSRVSINLNHFPDFDIPSPLFYKSFYFGAGVFCRFIKNKRFYNY
jgi:hypothetical protein